VLEPARYLRSSFGSPALDLLRLTRVLGSFVSPAYAGSTLYSSILEYCLEMDNSATITLDESNFDREVNQTEKAVIVDFWAEWCGPCKMIAPLLDEIAREKAESVKVAKVNVDDNQSLSFKFNIRAIPSLLFFKNGQLRDQVTGMTSKKDLLGRIEALG
jgi:thioredoxin 1